MCIFDNYSHEYKTRRIFELWIKSCYITNLTLNDRRKGTVRQFLSHFKEKLRLLDSLVPVSDQLPETTRITFLQRAVQQNHDLRQIHVMDSVWRFKTDSTDALTFDTYYNLLWDAAHQYDLHQVKKGPQRKAFFVENSSSRFYLISCSQGILNSSRLSCYLLLRLLVYMYLSQLMRTFTNYLKYIVISS